MPREDARVLKLVRRLLVLAILAGVVIAAWRRLVLPAAPSAGAELRPGPAPVTPPPRPHDVLVPSGVEPEGGPEVDGVLGGIDAWVVADGGACPPSHPVKAKLSSGIFHLPGGSNYARTRADRCYLDSTSATADGLRQAQR